MCLETPQCIRTAHDGQELNTTGQREHRKTAENTPQDSKWMCLNLHSLAWWKLERRSGATKQLSVLCM